MKPGTSILFSQQTWRGSCSQLCPRQADSSREHNLQTPWSGHGNVIPTQAWFPAKGAAKLQRRGASTSVCMGRSLAQSPHKVSKWGWSNLQSDILISIFLTNSYLEKSFRDAGWWFWELGLLLPTDLPTGGILAELSLDYLRENT